MPGATGRVDPPAERRSPMPLFMDTHRIDGGVAVDAPDAEAADRVNREAHGLVADSVHSVVEGV